MQKDLVNGSPRVYYTCMNETNYQGWANYETWNVALYLNNDYALYMLKKEFKDYAHFQSYIECSYLRETTPDEVSYFDPKLNHAELDTLFKES